MGKSGNPARRAAEADQLVQQTAKVLRDLVELVGALERDGLHPDALIHAQAAGAGLLAVHSYQTGQKPPWERLKEIR